MATANTVHNLLLAALVPQQGDDAEEWTSLLSASRGRRGASTVRGAWLLAAAVTLLLVVRAGGAAGWSDERQNPSGRGTPSGEPGRLAEVEAKLRKAVEREPTNPTHHFGLGEVLYKQGKLAEAAAAYQKAIALDPKDARPHNNLGNVLFSQGRLAEAAAAYRKATALDPKNAFPHVGLGNVLYAHGRRAEATAAYRKAIALDPKFALPHHNLGSVLKDQGKLTEAAAEYRQAIALDPKFALPHYYLGLLLQGQGKLTEAATEYRAASDLGLQPAQEQQRRCERLLALTGRLPAVLKGDDRPTVAELVEFAGLCQQPYQRRYAAATRLFAAAFTAQPKRADDMDAQHRYNAACAAAQAGNGQGVDADKLDDQEKARLRNQALAWLQADLAHYAKLAEGKKPQDHELVQERLRHWQRDADLAVVRGDAIDRLPEKERGDWKKLWVDADQVLQKAARAGK